MTLSRRTALAAGLAAVGTAAFAQPPLPAPRRLKVGLASRHLQFMVDVDEAVEAARQVGFDSIEWAVREGGHVPPEQVKAVLPVVVEKTRKAGLAVEMIITGIQDARTPHAEAILATARDLGIRHYRNSAYYRYDYAKPLPPQIEALAPRLASLVPLNERYGTLLCYHTHSGRGMIGGNVWDIWQALRGLDPASLGLNYDSGHTFIRGGSGWGDAARVARPYVKALALKDYVWTKDKDGKPRAEFCPMGQGFVDFDQYFGFFRDTGFEGPVNIHYEHSDLLGADVGKWTPSRSKADILALFKADLEFTRGKMKAAGLA